MRKLLAALVMIGGLALANFSAPALATPTNTVFDRTISGCDFEFKYGSVFGAAYAEVRVAGGDPSGLDCWIYYTKVFYVQNGQQHTATGSNGGDLWSDNNVWHNIVVQSATGWAGEWSIGVYHADHCWGDNWILQASIYESYPEGQWIQHSTTSQNC